MKTVHGFYQLNRSVVNMEKLKQILRAFPIDLNQNDELPSEIGGSTSLGPLHTRLELDDLVQCSVEELDTALRSIGAFEYRGHMRVLSLDTEYIITKHIVLTIHAEGMDHQQLRKDDVLALAKDPAFPFELVLHLVDSYLSPSKPIAPTSSTEKELYTFNIPKYGTMVAQTLLQSKPQILLSTLMASLKQKLPDNFPIDASVLDGLVVMEESGSDTKLTYLPATSMSHTPKTRLAELFKHKPKWTFAQLKPYLQDLVTHDMNEEQILVAHTRSSNGPGGIKLYSSR
jgi:hypothetical protein